MSKIKRKKVLFFIALLIIAINIGILSFYFYNSISPTDYIHIDKTTKSRVNEIVQNNDIMNSCLLLTKEYYEDIDIEQANIALDNIVYEIKARIKNTDDPQSIIETISDYLYDEYQMQVEMTKDFEHIMPNKVLENRKGHCLCLTLLYLTIGERLNLPLFAKIVPSHIFVCYDDGSTQFNIETTSRDFLQPDSEYYDFFPDPEQYRNIRKLNKRQTLGIFLNNFGLYMGQNPNVLDIQKKALILFPDYSGIQLNIAQILWNQNEHKQAKSHLTRAANLEPVSCRTNVDISKLYYVSGNYKKAEEFCIKSINLLKKSVHISAELRDELPEKEKLIEWAGQLLQNEQAEYENILGYGLILFQLKEYDLSNRLLAHALKLYPDKLKTHDYFAKTNFHLGNYEETRKHEQIARQAGQIKDMDEERSLAFTIDSLADCYMILGQSYAMLKIFDSALTNCQKAIETGGSQSKYYSSLAGTYWLKGDNTEAIKYYEKALELDPSDTFVQDKLSELK